MTNQEIGKAAFITKLKLAIRDPALLALNMRTTNETYNELPDFQKEILSELSIGELGAIKRIVSAALDNAIDTLDFSDKPDDYEIRYKGTRIFDSF